MTGEIPVLTPCPQYAPKGVPVQGLAAGAGGDSIQAMIKSDMRSTNVRSVGKLVPIGKLKKKADGAFSKWIRRGGRCVASGNGFACGGNLQCAHIFSRSRLSVRWDAENALPLCYAHHLFWAHRQPIEFAQFVQKRMGKEKLDALQKRSQRLKQWKREELEVIIARYSNEAS